MTNKHYVRVCVDLWSGFMLGEKCIDNDTNKSFGVADKLNLNLCTLLI